MGYSPFKILYERHLRGILDVLREEWESELTRAVSLSANVAAFWDKMKATAQLAKEELGCAQDRQKE